MPEPISAVFQQRLVAHDDEIDQLGHVSNVAIVRWIQDVAVAHSADVGWDYAAYRRHGAVFVVRRHEVDYLRPVLRGHEVVVETWIESWHAASSIRCTCIRRAQDEVLPTRSSVRAAPALDADGGVAAPPSTDGYASPHPGELRSPGNPGSRRLALDADCSPNPGPTSGSAVLVASARTQWVLVSIDSGRPRRIPEVIASSFLRPLRAVEPC